MSAVATPLHVAARAVYADDDGEELQLPIVGLDARDRPLILGLEGRIALATKARPCVVGSIYTFQRVAA